MSSAWLQCYLRDNIHKFYTSAELVMSCSRKHFDGDLPLTPHFFLDLEQTGQGLNKPRLDSSIVPLKWIALRFKIRGTKKQKLKHANVCT